MIAITTSLRARLVLWLAAGAAALATVLLIDARLAAARDAERAYDAQLTAATLALADAIRWAGEKPVVTVPAAALRILSGATEERVYYGVFDESGRALTANLDLPITDTPPPTRGHDVWRTLAFDGTRWRLHGERLDLAGWSRHTSLTIWVGQTLTGRRALAAQLFEPAVVRFLILMLAAGGLGLIAIASALAPVRRLRERLAARRADDFTALDARVPAEIAPLAAVLDALFARQRSARDVLVRFTADASHQLKTPLAGLANTSEAALESDDPAVWRAALSRINTSAHQSARLAGQLLQMARLTHEPEPQAPIDLARLVAETTLAYADRPAAMDHGHDIGLAERAVRPVWVRGTRWALQEALNNLIDNAVVHTPAGTTITVFLETDENGVLLGVDDDGPGLAEADADALLGAFRRDATVDTPGSGLGLAIVASIAEAHHGTFRIADRPEGGCRAALRLPILSGNAT